MLGTRILLISQNPRIRQQVLRALNSTGCEVTHLEALAEARSFIERTQIRILLVDVDDVSNDIASFLAWLAESHAPLPVLLLSQQESKERLIPLLERQNFNNLIAKHGAINASEEIIDEHELIVTCEKLLRRDIFGLEKYISGWGIHVHSEEIASSREKHEVIERFEQFAHRVEAAAQIVQAAALVADELITNAIFNAPRDASGTPKYAHLTRSKELILEPNERILFRYGCDGRYLALAVVDNFGSLQRDTIVGYLRKCFSRGEDQIDKKQGGAGLGIYMLFNSLTQLIFNIHYGRRTEVVATFYIRGGYRAFRKSGQSLNVFVTSDDTGQIVLPRHAIVAEPSIWVQREGLRQTVTIGGTIDEGFELEGHVSGIGGPIALDLRGVTQIDGPGALALMTSVRALSAKAKVTLVNCSPPVVNALSGLRAEGASEMVASVLVPYVCESCAGHEQVVASVSAGVAVIGAPPPCAICGKILRCEVDETRYLSLLRPPKAGSPGG